MLSQKDLWPCQLVFGHLKGQAYLLCSSCGWTCVSKTLLGFAVVTFLQRCLKKVYMNQLLVDLPAPYLRTQHLT